MKKLANKTLKGEQMEETSARETLEWSWHAIGVCM